MFNYLRFRRHVRFVETRKRCVLRRVFVRRETMVVRIGTQLATGPRPVRVPHRPRPIRLQKASELALLLTISIGTY